MSTCNGQREGLDGFLPFSMGQKNGVRVHIESSGVSKDFDTFLSYTVPNICRDADQLIRKRQQ